MKIKICCIRSEKEAALATAAGVDAVGFVSKRLNPESGLLDVEIRQIAGGVPESITTLLLTAEIDVMDIAERQRATGVRAVQLVGAIPPSEIRELRDRLPNTLLIKVIHVEDESTIELAADYAEAANCLLLDTKVRGPKGVALGGTGVTHDWAISREIVRRSPIPVVLAGGLAAGNVAEAIRRVRPFAVDVCSGVRRAGHLDRAALAAFTEQVGSASA